MYFTDLRVKLQNFFRKYKYQIYIVAIVITIIVAINIFLGKLKESEPPSTSYTPHEPIISGSEVKSKSTQKNIETAIQEYMDLCNKKDYEAAYNLLSEDCRRCRFDDKLDKFKTYIDSIYDGNKIYSIQDYSNKDNVYIYQVTISEDIMATGMNNENSDVVYEEKVALTKDGNDYKLAVGGFIKTEALENTVEDDYMKIYLVQKDTYYDKAVYKIKVKNKTDNTIVLDRNSGSDWIGVSLNGDNRKETKDNYSDSEKVIRGNQTKEFELTFPVYFDETKQPTSITLNKVCILERYTGVEELWEQELENAIKKYSVTISLK